MKKLLLSLLLSVAPLAVLAQAHSAADVKKDIQRHRAMATAHEVAAKCLESGKASDICLRELQSACKGLAIGKYCGMKHDH